jgi:hypothetical protein
MPGGRPRKSTEGVDEKTLKAREKATNYAAKKRMELESLKLQIMDCEEDLKIMKNQKKEIKRDLKAYDNYEDIKLSSLFNSPAPTPKAFKKIETNPFAVETNPFAIETNPFAPNYISPAPKSTKKAMKPMPKPIPKASPKPAPKASPKPAPKKALKPLPRKN